MSTSRIRLSAPGFRHGGTSRVARADVRATTVSSGASFLPIGQNTRLWNTRASAKPTSTDSYHHASRNRRWRPSCGAAGAGVQRICAQHAYTARSGSLASPGACASGAAPYLDDALPRDAVRMVPMQHWRQKRDKCALHLIHCARMAVAEHTWSTSYRRRSVGVSECWSDPAAAQIRLTLAPGSSHDAAGFFFI